MTATIYNPEGAVSVRVRDLSAEGANVCANQPLPKTACDLIFKRGVLFVAGRLVWSDDHGGGIRFYRCLTPAEIAATYTTVFIE